MIGAAIANFVQFPSIDREIGDIYNSISVYQDEGMAAIGQVHSRSVTARFGLSLQIGALAPGATIDLGGVDTVLVEELYGLGRAASVVDGGQQQVPRQLDQIAMGAEVAATGTDRELGPYTIALGEAPRELQFLLTAERLWVVDAELLRRVGPEADR